MLTSFAAQLKLYDPADTFRDHPGISAEDVLADLVACDELAARSQEELLVLARREAMLSMDHLAPRGFCGICAVVEPGDDKGSISTAIDLAAEYAEAGIDIVLRCWGYWSQAIEPCVVIVCAAAPTQADLTRFLVHHRLRA